MPASDSPAKAFYATTPIFYVNDAPHIGHAYTEVASDVLTRWHRQRGEKAFLLTGTDEHGEKILRTATANQSTPQAWADRLVAEAWLPLLETIDIDNQDFIRTTEPRHEKNVQLFLQQLYDTGFIYRGSYEGNYCVGCEEYKTEGDLLDGDGEFAGQQVCAIHSKPVERLEETNYFFKLSEFQKPLLDYYEANPKFIQPESARNEVMAFVRRGLEDLSISRSKEKFDWGIDIPWDDSHITYVWFDALLNYITAIGYGENREKFESLWPASVQVVGKDILRFHAVIWPAMLMAANLPPAERVFGHGWLLVGGEKMSKSLGNFTNLLDLVESTDPRAYRLLVLRSHYRTPLEVTRATTDDASAALRRLDAFARRAANAGLAGEPDAASVEGTEIWGAFIQQCPWGGKAPEGAPILQRRPLRLWPWQPKPPRPSG